MRNAMDRPDERVTEISLYSEMKTRIRKSLGRQAFSIRIVTAKKNGRHSQWLTGTRLSLCEV